MSWTRDVCKLVVALFSMTFFFIGLVTYIVGFSTTAWFKDGRGFWYGVLRVCGNRSGECWFYPDLEEMEGVDLSHLYVLGQTLTSAGLAILLLDTALVIYCVLKPWTFGHIPVFLLQFATASFGMTGANDYLDKGREWCLVRTNYYSVEWSAVVFMLGCVGNIVSGFLMVIYFLIPKRREETYEI